MKKSNKDLSLLKNPPFLISLVLMIFAFLLIQHGANVFAFEAKNSFANGALGWIFFTASLIWAALAPRVNLISTQSDNVDVFLNVLIWGVLLVAGFLAFGYISTEFNNPYL